MLFSDTDNCRDDTSHVPCDEVFSSVLVFFFGLVLIATFKRYTLLKSSHIPLIVKLLLLEQNTKKEKETECCLDSGRRGMCEDLNLL
jgi:hypothetical protein